ncbi:MULTISPECIES: 50S ribosomal protein L13 [Paenibacillus]|uniref:Large ribosomal subunit protein uL13 n=1 Tax=Paenibacillus borealis TaxID=160799 RepID=A0ABX3H233_PAEBO|nr:MULTISPECIES: 50S ribosomal protein L13 [Paenibacillus]AIQ20743.1 50S ribosomal protein L13 [Paenibacillus sp. FSL H7-0357]OMD43898.1 50S ribosomal protein L13 [Paenibacillus borealis]
MRTTYMAKPNEVERTWHIIDAEGKTLGRLASEAAALIRGKHKPQFTPHVDTGDFVIVINAEKIHLTGKKMQNKKYYRHSMHPGGLKVTVAEDLIKTKPERMIEFAVHGMIPKTRQGDHMKLRLKVYAGAEHPHAAQKPEVYELRG